MRPLLLDAGVWIGAADTSDPFHASARAIVLDFDRRIATLDLTMHEVANVLGVRKESAREARHVLELMMRRCRPDGPLAADPGLLDLAVSIAGEHRLTSYDAAYVAAATSNGWTLVSSDIADLVSRGLAVTPDAALYP